MVECFWFAIPYGHTIPGFFTLIRPFHGPAFQKKGLVKDPSRARSDWIHQLRGTNVPGTGRSEEKNRKSEDQNEMSMDDWHSASAPCFDTVARLSLKGPLVFGPIGFGHQTWTCDSNWSMQLNTDSVLPLWNPINQRLVWGSSMVFSRCWFLLKHAPNYFWLEFGVRI